MGKAITWKTQSGEVWRIMDMEDSHLLNTIRYLRRRVNSARAYLIQKSHDQADDCACYSGNGEYAQIAAEDAMTSAFDRVSLLECGVITDDQVLSEVIPQWTRLQSERKTRKLVELID